MGQGNIKKIQSHPENWCSKRPTEREEPGQEPKAHVTGKRKKVGRRAYGSKSMVRKLGKKGKKKAALQGSHLLVKKLNRSACPGGDVFTTNKPAPCGGEEGPWKKDFSEEKKGETFVWEFGATNAREATRIANCTRKRIKRNLKKKRRRARRIRQTGEKFNRMGGYGN